MPSTEYIFRKNDRVGVAAAEDDLEMLRQCFIDTGDLDILRDCSDSRCIVQGRTGSGKSALLMEIEQHEERTIRVKPESLAMTYISNSRILAALSELGVNFDTFFRLLWRHVFAVEILQHRFAITSEDAKATLAERIRRLFQWDEKTTAEHTRAIEYLNRWGQSFWKDTDYRIRELTTTLERNIEGSLGVKSPLIGAKIAGAEAIKEQERAELVERAQKVVDQVQMRELSAIIGLIDAVLVDPQKRFYVVIDGLDERWVDDLLRYRLIRALVETVRDFRRVTNCKILVALRRDLIERVYESTRDAGFQEEKYEGMALELRWHRDDLARLINARVNTLVRHPYTKAKVVHAEIFPDAIDGQNTMEYLFERTLMRPRDAIHFVNRCIDEAVGSPAITPAMIRAAEGVYSRERLSYLADEWSADYPHLRDFARVFEQFPQGQRLAEVAEMLQDRMVQTLTELPTSNRIDPLVKAVEEFFKVKDGANFVVLLLMVFHRVGLIGLKVTGHETTLWADSDARRITSDEINDTTRIYVHPMFFRVLNITP